VFVEIVDSAPVVIRTGLVRGKLLARIVNDDHACASNSEIAVWGTGGTSAKRAVPCWSGWSPGMATGGDYRGEPRGWSVAVKLRMGVLWPGDGRG